MNQSRQRKDFVVVIVVQRAYASGSSIPPPIAANDDFENYPAMFDGGAWPATPDSGSVSTVGVVAAVVVALSLAWVLDL